MASLSLLSDLRPQGRGNSLIIRTIVLIWDLISLSPKRICKAKAAGENSSFILQYVPFYRFKLANVVLHMAVTNCSKPTSKNREIGRFNRSLLIESF